MNAFREIRLKVRNEKLDSFRRKCKEHGLSITPQRLAIYELLITSQNHPSAEDVFHRIRTAFPDISIDTVYRTLATFSEIGIINIVEGYGEAKRYDPDVHSHHHFRCLRCKQLIDFQEPAFSRLKIPGSIRKKCKVSNVKVLLEGVCDRCLSEN